MSNGTNTIDENLLYGIKEIRNNEGSTVDMTNIDINNAFVLASLIDGINGGVKISRNESKFPFCYVSEAMAAIQGYTPSELMAKHPTAVGNGHPEDISRIAQKMLKDFKETGKYTAKYRVQHKDGRWLWVQDNGKLVVLPDGTELVYSLIQDIDTSERTRIILQTERAMFRDVLTKGALYTIVADITDGQITEPVLTPDGKDMFAEQGVKIPCDFDEQGKFFCKTFDVVPIGEMPVNYFKAEDLIKLYDQGIQNCSQEYHMRAVDAYIRVDGYITKDPITNHIISNGVCFDITEKKKRELAIKEQAKEAEEQKKRIEELTMVNRINSQFIQNMSHEIRTPLNAVVGFSSVLSDSEMVKGMNDDEKREAMNLISSNATLLTSIVDDILDLSDLQSGKYKIMLDTMNVNEVCRTCLKSVEHRLPQGVAMEFVSDISDDYTICSDHRRIKQVIINFLTNACKHTSEGSITLSASLREKPKYLTLSVTDTGIGIPVDKAEIIFERFEKLNIFSQGSGLGLAICKLVADMLKGDVRLDTSYTGGGARFVFEIPI